MILQYHHVADDTPAATSVSPDRFAEHINWLLENDYRVLPLPEIVAAIRANKELPERAAAITFDDAYANIYNNAFALLKKHDLPFTIFTNTDSVERGYSSHTSWEQLREMARHGATIANHSHTHAHMARRLPGESEKQWLQRVRQEVERAQQLIEERTDQRERLFAWPYGEFDLKLEQLLREMDFVAFGQQSGPVGPNQNMQALPRFPVSASYGAPEAFATRMKTRPMPLASVKAPDNPLPFDNARPVLELILAEDFDADSVNCFASGQGAIPVERNGKRLTVRAPRDIPVGRSRYNCTAAAGNGHFYWVSNAWIRLRKDGSWVLD